MYLLYPESRKLMMGYKVYEVITDDQVKEIISQLSDKKFSQNTEILTSDQLRSLILLALGLNENSLLSKTLDNLGSIPTLERSLTLAEATEAINKLARFLPELKSLKSRSNVLEKSLVTLEGWGSKIAGSEVWQGINDSLGNAFSVDNLKSTAKGLTGWLKNIVAGIFGKSPTEEEVKELVKTAEETAQAYTAEVAEKAYRVFD